MKSIGLLLVIAAALAPGAAVAAEWTNTQTIARTDYDGNADAVWFVPLTIPWGPAGCPDAVWVVVGPEVPGRKQLMAVALAAQMTGKAVAFWGTCESSDRFRATYMKVVTDGNR